MNWTICSADATTHLKIIATALFAATVVVWIGIVAHVSSSPRTASMTGKALTIAHGGNQPLLTEINS